MLSLFDKMFIKRFCLPADSDIHLYETGKCKMCVYEHFNHVSCVFNGNGKLKKVRVLSFGVNQMGNKNGNHPGVHAECDGLSKLIPRRHKKRLETINILVLRLSGKNKLQSSKPCINCIETMKSMPPKMGYIIKNIYYSDSNGNIIKTNLNSLDAEEKHYSRCSRTGVPPTIIRG